MEQSFLEKLKRIRLKDILHIFFFLAAFPAAMIFRRKHRHLWLLCEYENEARDNAYFLFRYLRTEHPEQEAVYAIRTASPDYEKVRSLGPVVPYGTFRHWVYYLAAEKNISSQKGGKPNAAVCYALEVLGPLKNKRAFLQHGIIKDDLPFLHYEKAKFSLFVCAANPEYEYVREKFGYPPGVVQNLGLCRYDGLLSFQRDPKLVLVMPTWRDRIYRSCPEGKKEEFQRTEYYRSWEAFLKSPRLAELLERFGLRMIFMPHRNMSRFSASFSSSCGRIVTAGWEQYEVQALLKESALLITDYSSVAMDFSYMRKPLLYYQFDYREFRDGHLPEGYFSYERDGFGPVCGDLDGLLDELEKSADGGFLLPEKYLERQKSFFSYHDADNCRRNYEAIQKM